ncbi:MAG: sialidase family protein [Planctomycetia bacterium]|nr:sialidase family protein [Planctomycetia bacterium]
MKKELKIKWLVLVLVGWITCGAFGIQAAEEEAKRPIEPSKVFFPDDVHQPSNRFFTGIPSIAIAKNGRMWATWYTGPTACEDPTNYAVLSTSTDGGKNWKEVYVSDPDGLYGRRVFDPEVWITPDGRLFWTWTDRVGDLYSDPKDDQLWLLELDSEKEPTNPNPTPRCIGTGIMMCKPIVLSTGEWLFPVARWFDEVSARVLVTTDGGKTFTERGGASLPKQNRAYDEHTIVEKRNGDLWMLIRSSGGNGMFESFSKDRGKTWTPAVPARIKHTSSRFFITRLESGALLLVKHGPIDQDVGRIKMMAFISDDDGETWKGGLMIDSWIVSYPDGCQAADGMIYVTYDCHRRREREIHFSPFTEAEVRAGREMGTFKPRCLISKSTGSELKLEEPKSK